MTNLSLTVSRIINAPVEAVFNAWLDPEMLAKFMRPMESVEVSDVTVEPRQGGRFSLNMLVGENKLLHGGEYKTIDPHSQIVFSWESPASIDGSLVTLNFSTVDGGTNIELNHVKFLSEETRDNHQGGWTNILTCLGNEVA